MGSEASFSFLSIGYNPTYISECHKVHLALGKAVKRI